MSAPVTVDLTVDSEPEADRPVKRRKVSPPADPSPPGPGSDDADDQHQRPRLRAGFGYLRTKHIGEEANR